MLNIREELKWLGALISLREGEPSHLKRVWKLVADAPVFERRARWGEVTGELVAKYFECAHRYEQQILKWHEQGVSLVGIYSSKYPSGLYALPDPPLVLFMIGQISDHPFAPLSRNVAIVGSRKADGEGIALSRWFAREFVQYGFTVVSGLAYGADAAAHWGSLGVPGVELPTVAVLGGGVRVIYPKSHSRLAREILSNNGLIISEYPPDATPRPHTFLERNRIIAGLAQGVIVIQAGKRSGALVTARNALDIGRDVYVVPGSIHNPLYEGSNRFIQDGATPIVHPFEFLKEFGAAEKVCDANSNVSSPLQRKILCYLSSYGPTSEEKLCKEVHGADTEVEMALQELAIHDRVRKVFGGRYCVI